MQLWLQVFYRCAGVFTDLSQMFTGVFTGVYRCVYRSLSVNSCFIGVYRCVYRCADVLTGVLQMCLCVYLHREAFMFEPFLWINVNQSPPTQEVHLLH